MNFVLNLMLNTVLVMLVRNRKLVLGSMLFKKLVHLLGIRPKNLKLLISIDESHNLHNNRGTLELRKENLLVRTTNIIHEPHERIITGRLRSDGSNGVD